MHEPIVLVLFILCIFFLAEVMPDGASSRPSVSLPGCPDKCGDVSIPYPFGIGEQCAAASINSNFIITCNDTFHPPRPTVGGESVVEVTNISLDYGEMRVLSPISHICFTSSTNFTKLGGVYNLQSTPFLPSASHNRFTVIGCNTLGLIGGYKVGTRTPQASTWPGATPTARASTARLTVHRVLGWAAVRLQSLRTSLPSK